MPSSQYNNSKKPNQATAITVQNASAIFASLAKQVKFCKPWKIYFLSCNMGVKEGGIAQILAMETGCKVYAPMGYCRPKPTMPKTSILQRKSNMENAPVYDGAKDDYFREYAPEGKTKEIPASQLP